MVSIIVQQFYELGENYLNLYTTSDVYIILPDETVQDWLTDD